MNQTNGQIFECPCGSKVHVTAACCPTCGNRSKPNRSANNPNSVPRSKGVALLLHVFFGFLGASHFYRGDKDAGWMMVVLSVVMPVFLFNIPGAESTIFIPLIISGIWSFCTFWVILFTPSYGI